MVFIIIKHGQTIYNKNNIIIGRTDIKLTDQGEKETIKMAKVLKKYNFDYAFTSDSIDTKDTCKIIKKELNQNFNVISSCKLNERDHGYLKDKNKYEMENIYTPEKIFKWCNMYDGVPPNGESLYQVSMRSGNYFDNNIKNLITNGKNILFIGHIGTIKSLLIYLKIKDTHNIEKFDILNCQAIEINIKNKSLKYLGNEHE